MISHAVHYERRRIMQRGFIRVLYISFVPATRGSISEMRWPLSGAEPRPAELGSGKLGRVSAPT